MFANRIFRAKEMDQAINLFRTSVGFLEMEISCLIFMRYYYFYKDKTLMCLGDELTDKDETVLLELGFDRNDCVAGNFVIWYKKG